MMMMMLAHSLDGHECAAVSFTHANQQPLPRL